jgi:hypothetical protein
MTRFRIHEQEPVEAIELTKVGDRQTAILEAFRECQEGRCDCRTDECQKVSAMAVEPEADQIQIRFRCLDTELGSQCHNPLCITVGRVPYSGSAAATS